MATYKRPTNHKYMGEARADLPASGYVIKIYDAKIKKWPSGDEYFEISFDIAEGEYKDFYKKDYGNQTGDNKWWRGTYTLNPPKEGDAEWKINKFWDFFYALEDSNPGYQFSGDTADINKAKLAGKLLGATFRREEKPSKKDISKTFWNTVLFNAKPAETIRDGKFSVPKDKPYAKGSSASSSEIDGFVNLPEGPDEELPF